jgi:hypothetical protein
LGANQSEITARFANSFRMNSKQGAWRLCVQSCRQGWSLGEWVPLIYCEQWLLAPAWVGACNSYFNWLTSTNFQCTLCHGANEFWTVEQWLPLTCTFHEDPVHPVPGSNYCDGGQLLTAVAQLAMTRRNQRKPVNVKYNMCRTGWKCVKFWCSTVQTVTNVGDGSIRAGSSTILSPGHCVQSLSSAFSVTREDRNLLSQLLDTRGQGCHIGRPEAFWRANRAGGQPCPLRLIWIGQGTVDREITVPNLLYCSNFSYYFPPTWSRGRWQSEVVAHRSLCAGARLTLLFTMGGQSMPVWSLSGGREGLSGVLGGRAACPTDNSARGYRCDTNPVWDWSCTYRLSTPWIRYAVNYSAREETAMSSNACASQRGPAPISQTSCPFLMLVTRRLGRLNSQRPQAISNLRPSIHT